MNQTATVAWTNWSGSVVARKAMVSRPRGLAELADVIRTAPGPIRIAGAGHSFTPLVETDGTILELERFQGLVSHDAIALQATVGAATRLGDLTKHLHAAGQGLANMGDIDKQSIGGALGTATHGSGVSLGAYHSQLRAMEIVDGRGDVRQLTIDNDRETIEATGVTLGAFGALTEVTLQNIASYRLRRRRWVVPIGDILASCDTFMSAHRSAEFYFIPFSGHALLITSDISTADVSPRPAEEDEEGLATLKQLRTWLGWLPPLRRALIGAALARLPEEDYVQDWLNVYTSDRRRKFNEMEYHLPYEEGPRALAEIITLTEKHFPEVYFPMEVRSVAPDEFWLSPFYRRKTCSIAIHHDAAEDPKAFMAAAEAIFRRYGGRPHWGKMHNLVAADFASIYPRWKDAMAVRRSFDPDNRFVSPYLARLLGVA
ncbi:FAD-linked oxidoreductase [Rhizobium subbaraonis]|uniref:FAD-linked oxidoreductase n=1 Tax=Rhizobium subbaraonis TaxID=908946 RepID=A0A285U360_9HYPH|nr:D-arabinono-1,4-lactone oxidase [Rhizobium subbaraonis]SOC36153.1 FAD-linked oxidoreductase [Rhizobium subbaraonis]